jgi:hypothetical protein
MEGQRGQLRQLAAAVLRLCRKSSIEGVQCKQRATGTGQQRIQCGLQRGQVAHVDELQHAVCIERAAAGAQLAAVDELNGGRREQAGAQH